MHARSWWQASAGTCTTRTETNEIASDEHPSVHGLGNSGFSIALRKQSVQKKSNLTVEVQSCWAPPARCSIESTLEEKTETGRDEVRFFMIRNIPCRCTPEQVRGTIEELGFGSEYIFFYLPTRYRQIENLGYAFVGFLHHDVAVAFAKTMQGFKFPGRSSQKSCDIVPSHIQSLQENLEHFVLTHCMYTENGPLLQL